MRKLFSIFLIFSILPHCSFAQQPTAEDYKRIAEEANKKAAEFLNDPKVKAAMEQAKKMSGQRANVPTTNDIKNIAVKPEVLKPDNRKLPERNNVLLGQLPKKTLTRNELATYLNTLDAQLNQKIKSTSADSAKSTIKQLGNDGTKLSYAAIVAWYKNDVESAVMLASKAATLSLDNDAALSNCAAIFTMAGLENKAIPILKVLLQREPNSSTVLNNIGQAYTGLGEVDTAMYYFGRCIKIAPTHPEANNTATIICIKKGQTEQAKKYCKQSLQGGLTSEAVRSYSLLYKDDDIEKLIDIEPWKSYPFNEHDFTFPPQCEKIDDAAAIKQELDAYAARYRAMAKKYENGYSAEMRSKAEKIGAQYAKNPLQNLDLVDADTHYTRRAGYAYHRISTQLIQDIYDVIFKHAKEIDILKVELEAKQKGLNKKRDGDLEACGNSNLCEVKVIAAHCRQQNELSNEYLPKFAVVNRDYVSKRWRLAKELFEAYSVYVRTAVKHNTIQFYNEEASRIGILFSSLINGEILSDGYVVINPYCDMTDAELAKIDSMELKENKNCNLSVEIPLEVAKFTFTCDEFEIEGGEGIKAKYNKNFRTGQTTLYVGVGASTHIPGFEAGATQYVFVCFDKNNRPVDVGTQGELELDVKGVVKGDQKIILGTTMNTGVHFEPGPLKALTDVLPYAFK